MDLHHRSDHELLVEVGKLIGSHRELTARLVAHLAEIEERRLHLLAGYASMFEFCVKELKLSDGEAFRRILAARLGRRFPVVYSLLTSGAVHLTALELVRERLTDENHVELLEAISGKSKREVEALLAARFPRPDVPSKIRRLPEASVNSGAAEPSVGVSLALESCARSRTQVPARGRIEPLSETRFRVEFTARAELREKLELCRDLMSHANPTRELGAVVERAVDLLLVELERKRLGRTKRPPRGPASRSARTGRVTNAVRRRVYERDGLRCTYVSPEGRRCEERTFLELDHAVPRGIGGGDEPENLRVRCRAHNQLWAEQAYGREHVERARHLRQQKCRRADDGKELSALETSATKVTPLPALEKVRLALKCMGFRDGEARQAVAQVERMHAELPAVEQALREAILVATAKPS